MVEEKQLSPDLYTCTLWHQTRMRACTQGSMPVGTTPSPTTFSAFPCFVAPMVTVC